MSSVDERIVRMTFDNSEFSKKIGSTIESLTQLNKSTEQIANNTSGLSVMGEAFAKAEEMATSAGFHIKDVWLKVASVFETQVANKIVNVSKQIANAMTFQGVNDGFKEYELKMGSIQTIMMGTGESLATVNKYLDELNTYSDQTIYSFADMTNNIGKFTNAGVKLNDAVAAIKGIANEAAISGANAQQASHAMYNFSQALSAGYVKLIDWKSIENAQMATIGFKETLLEVASAVGTVSKESNGMYKVLTKNANGKAMGELVSGSRNFNDSLQQQWMTTEVLTKALKIYATDVRKLSDEEKLRYENELKAMGLTPEQIKHFEELGSKATDAASEIKTFTMLIDTLKEAIGSGWAMTWQNLIGDFEEAKQLWTEVGGVLSDFISDQANARNQMLSMWKDTGGRTDAIEGLRKGFQLLGSVLSKVSSAMREVFPRTTTKQLWDITHGFRLFMEQLKISETTLDNVHRTAKGFFSIFGIGAKFVKAFVGALIPAAGGALNLADGLLGVTASIGDFLVKLDESITKSKTFESVFSGVSKVLSPILNFNGSLISGAFDLLAKAFDKLSNINMPFDAIANFFTKTTDDVASGIDKLVTKMGGFTSILEGAKTVLSAVGKVIANVFKGMKDALSDFSLGGPNALGFMQLLNMLLSGGILAKLYNGTNIISSFSEVFDSVGDTLKSFSDQINATTLVSIATGVAILAGSLLIVASIDKSKLLGATAAISALAFALAGSVSLMLKAFQAFSQVDVSGSFSLFGKKIFGSDTKKLIATTASLKAIGKVLIDMAAAVLLMSVGLREVSKAAEGGHLWDSFAVISLMLGELTGVAIILGRWGGESKNGAKSLLAMTESLILVSVALGMVAKVVEGGNAVGALKILTAILIELTAVALLIGNFGKHKIGSTATLIGMALSINLVVVALKKISDSLGQDGQHMLEALGILSVIMVELTAATILMSKFGGFAALGGLGAIMGAAALLIFVQGLKQISDVLGQTDQHVWQALAVIGVALVELAVGLSAMVASIPGAAALLIASAALVVFAEALKMLGSMGVGGMIKSIIELGLGLAVLAVGLTAMVAAIPGAAALVIASAGLVVFAAALKMFASVSIWGIVKALLELVVGLTGLTVIATVLSVATPLVLLFSAGIAALGAALLITGAGLVVFSAGIESVVAILPFAAIAIKAIASAILQLVPVLAGAVVDTIAIIIAKISEYTPQLAKAGAEAMLSLLKTITEYAPQLADAGYKCMIALIDGLASAIQNNNTNLIMAVDHLMDAIIQAITQWLVEFTPLGALMPEKIKDGIMTGEFNVRDAFRDMIHKAIEGLKMMWEDFKKAGEYLIQGFIAGLKGSMLGRAVGAAVDLGSKVIAGLNSKDGLDEHSPSKKGEASGEYLDEGLREGIVKNANSPINAAKTLGDDVSGTLVDVLGSGIDGTGEAFAKLADEIDLSTDALARNEKVSEKVIAKNYRHALIMKRQRDRIKEHSEASSTDTEQVEENTAATEANTAATTKNSRAKGASKKETKDHADVTEYASGVLKEFTRLYGKMYEGLGETGPVDVATLAIKQLAESTYMASIKAKEAKDMNKETTASIEDMIKAFSELKGKIYDSVQSVFDGDSFFQKFEIKTEKSMADILEAMKSNVDAVASWSTKLAELGNKGVNQGLLQQLAELGPKGYEYVNAFSNATAEQIAEANTRFAEASALPDLTSNMIVASYAKAGLNAVAGFQNGIDENIVNAALSAENLGLTTLKTLEAALEEHSPSKRTHRDGMYLVMGMCNGVEATSPILLYKIRVLCDTVLTTMEKILSRDHFVSMGSNIGYGLAEGMSAPDVIAAVSEAAANLSQIASNITVAYNKIHSPSRRYRGYGKNIGYGFAGGMLDSIPEVVGAANEMSKAIERSLETVNDIVSGDTALHPVISPVLDLSNVTSKANFLKGLVPTRSIGLATSLRVASRDSINTQNEANNVPNQINFTQNNYSPKALSRAEIHRDTENQLSMVKGVIRKCSRK